MFRYAWVNIGEDENNFMKSLKKEKKKKNIFLDPKCIGYWTNTKIVMYQISRIHLSLKC